jgi:hypothetical protein
LCLNPNIHPFQNYWRSGRSVTSALIASTIEEQWAKIAELAAAEKQDEKVLGQVKLEEDTAPGQGADSQPPGQDDGDEPMADASENVEKRDVFWRKFAEETVRSCISLRASTSNEAELMEMLKTCDASKVKTVQGQSTIIKFYDEKLAGEALSVPNLRKPPRHGIYFKGCITAALAVENGRIGLGELVVHVLDHGKASMAGELKKSFSGFSSQYYDIFVDEESLAQRKGRRTNKLMKQSERMYMFASDPAAIPDEKRKYYKGTSKGQSWGGVFRRSKRAWRTMESGGDEEVEDTVDKTDVPFCYHGLLLMFFFNNLSM